MGPSQGCSNLKLYYSSSDSNLYMTNYPNLPDYTYYCNIYISCTCGSPLSLGTTDCIGGAGGTITSISVTVYSKLYC